MAKDCQKIKTLLPDISNRASVRSDNYKDRMPPIFMVITYNQINNQLSDFAVLFTFFA